MAEAGEVLVGVDIGGTFTDLLLVQPSSGRMVVEKVLTTPDDPTRAVVAGLSSVAETAGVAPASFSQVVHGTTLVTNALIERSGAATALLTTKGFRDAVAIGREHRYDLYDLSIQLPAPLVRRRWRLPVEERVLADGTIEQPLDLDQVRRLVAELRDGGIEAVAVCLLHSYRYPEHERRIGKLLAAEAPELVVSLSSDVVPEIREYERASTTICNVYVRPLVDRYLSRLESALQELGVNGPLLVMLSSGGSCTVETARTFPIRLVESGPAAGALAAAYAGRRLGYQRLLSFDMGGTTAKACLIDDFEPLIAPEFEVARVYRFKKGSGFPIKVPVIEMIEIGAGGGSIASVDALGLLRVGPRSAGAEPGPACYGGGGVEPTVTDADLLLGYLDPDYFLGGRMRLDVDAAERAITERIARPLGLTPIEAAWGIHQIVNESMASAARVHAVERGKDPRSYPVYAFGGAGPVHAFRVGKILHAPGLIIPASAGVGSTLGFLTAPPAFDYVRTLPSRLGETDWSAVNQLFAEMEAEGRELLLAAGVSQPEIQIRRTADMHYAGQGYDVNVPVPEGRLTPESLGQLLQSFESVYRSLYQRLASGNPIEVVNWRLVAGGPSRDLPLGEAAAVKTEDAAAAIKGRRSIYLPEESSFVDVPVYDRYRLSSGMTFDGPAVVEERESTFILGPGSVATVDAMRNLRVEFLT